MAIIKLIKALYLGCNVLDTLKTLKGPKRRAKKTKDDQFREAASEPVRRVSVLKREQMRNCLTVWVVWVAWDQIEFISDRSIGYVLPFYGYIKTLVLLYLMASRQVGASLVYNYLLFPQVFKPYSHAIDSILSLMSLVVELAIQVLLLVTIVPILAAWSRIKSLFVWRRSPTTPSSTRLNRSSRRKSSGSSGGSPLTPIRRLLPGSFSQKITDYALQTPRTLKKTVQVFRAPSAMATRQPKKTGEMEATSTASPTNELFQAQIQAQAARQKRYDALAASAAAARQPLQATRGRSRSTAMGPPARPSAATSRLNVRTSRSGHDEMPPNVPNFPAVPVNPFIDEDVDMDANEDADLPNLTNLGLSDFPLAPQHEPVTRSKAPVLAPALPFEPRAASAVGSTRPSAVDDRTSRKRPSTSTSVTNAATRLAAPEPLAAGSKRSAASTSMVVDSSAPTKRSKTSTSTTAAAKRPVATEPVAASLKRSSISSAPPAATKGSKPSAQKAKVSSRPAATAPDANTPAVGSERSLCAAPTPVDHFTPARGSTEAASQPVATEAAAPIELSSTSPKKTLPPDPTTVNRSSSTKQPKTSAAAASRPPESTTAVPKDPPSTSHKPSSAPGPTTLNLSPSAKRPQAFASAMAVAPIDLSGFLKSSQASPETVVKQTKHSLGKPVRPIKTDSATASREKQLVKTSAEPSSLKVSPKKRKLAPGRSEDEAGASAALEEALPAPKRSRAVRPTKPVATIAAGPSKTRSTATTKSKATTAPKRKLSPSPPSSQQVTSKRRSARTQKT